VLFAVGLALPLASLADLRPLSRAMLENARAVHAIGESLSVDDYAGVEAAARALEEIARRIRDWDLAELGFNRGRDSEFDHYLNRQEAIADEIMKAARREDAPAVSQGLGDLFEKACLACHKDFRERSGMLKPSTLFMTSFISAWRDMTRGLLLNDFSLVARSARSLGSIGRVMSWDPIIESAFGLRQAAQRTKFRQHLQQVIAAAERIEDAANRGEPERVTGPMSEMWQKGCLACHREFR
jgi:cytochrome c556